MAAPLFLRRYYLPLLVVLLPLFLWNSLTSTVPLQRKWEPNVAVDELILGNQKDQQDTTNNNNNVHRKPPHDHDRFERLQESKLIFEQTEKQQNAAGIENGHFNLKQQEQKDVDCVTQQSSYSDIPPLFNPFSDLKVQVLKDRNYSTTLYSCVHCVGTGTLEMQSDISSIANRRPNFMSRTCLYHNLYYRPKNKTFHYLASPEEVAVLREAIPTNTYKELSKRTEVAIGTAMEIHGPKKLMQRYHANPWKPEFHTSLEDFIQDAPNQVATFIQSNLTFLLYHAFHSNKISHFVWDDIMAWFSMLDLFHLGGGGKSNDRKTQPVPLFVELHNVWDQMYRCNTANGDKWSQCVKVYKKFLTNLFRIGTDPCGSGDVLRTGNFMRGVGNIGKWKNHAKDPICHTPKKHHDDDVDINATEELTNQVYNTMPENTEFVVLPTVIVGGARLGLFGCAGDCMLHRGPQFWRFRNYLWQNMFGSSSSGRAAKCRASSLSSSSSPSRKMPVGFLTFSLPVGSTRPGEVARFKEEIDWARRTYGNASVHAVDLATLTIQDQALLLANTAVFLTNHGGGSFVTLFLPKGSAALIFYAGNSRRDYNFHEAAGYYRTVWISPSDRLHFNRTTALIAQEYHRTKRLQWSTYGAYYEGQYG